MAKGKGEKGGKDDPAEIQRQMEAKKQQMKQLEMVHAANQEEMIRVNYTKVYRKR